MLEESGRPNLLSHGFEAGVLFLKSAFICLMCKMPKYTQSRGILFNIFLCKDGCYVATHKASTPHEETARYLYS